VALVNSITDILKKPRLRERTDRAWFNRLYNIRPGNGADLFLQSGAHKAPGAETRSRLYSGIRNVTHPDRGPNQERAICSDF